MEIASMNSATISKRRGRRKQNALFHELLAHGLAAFKNPTCQRRLADLSDGQLHELIAALIRVRTNYAALTNVLLPTSVEIKQ
jgi:hypothetical protein